MVFLIINANSPLFYLLWFQAGKTTISNYLSEATSSSSKEYHPTQGVRILEFESEYLDEDKSNAVEVELWDCAGSKKYENWCNSGFIFRL